MYATYVAQVSLLAWMNELIHKYNQISPQVSHSARAYSSVRFHSVP